MKRQAKKLRYVTNVLMALLLVGITLGTPVFPAPGTSASAPTPIGVRPGRQQFGAVGSGSIVVWQDNAIVADPARDTNLGTSDILGFDFSTNRAIVVTDAPGDQKAPAVSGSIVAWHDNRHSGSGGERDIRAKDLNTGTEYTVATGVADQAFPAVDGRTVVWMEGDENGQRLVGADIDGQSRVTIATASPGGSFRRPAISSDLIVWTEFTVQGKAVHHTIRAYDRATGVTQVVAESDWTGSQYAVSGRRVVWTDPSLNLADLGTGTRTILHPRSASSPTIVGDIVVWTGQAAEDPERFDLYGVDLRSGVVKPLVASATAKHRPVIAGDRLLWQSENARRWELSTTPLSEAFASTQFVLDTVESRSTQMPALVGQDIPGAAPQSQDITAMFTRPTYKGIHTANGTDGWYQSPNFTEPCFVNDQGQTVCPAIDALGAAQNDPFFGSYVVHQTDLTRDTGRTGFWGPKVQKAMRSLVLTWNLRVVVRTWPLAQYGQKYKDAGTTYPEPANSSNPSSPDWVAQQVIDLVDPAKTNRDWIADVQIENEPNLMWPCNKEKGNTSEQCKGQWTWGGRTTIEYTWFNMFDDQKYVAINAWYMDVAYALDWYANNQGSPLSETHKARLRAIMYWTPPMADIYDTLDDNDNMYNKLQGMINTFKGYGDGFAYHTYPAPNSDSDWSQGVLNTSWIWFPIWLANEVQSQTTRSIITEFGWNPGQMRRFQPGIQGGEVDKNCWSYGTLKHNIQWPTDGQQHPDGTCQTEDGFPHTFDRDVLNFLANRRHGAEIVAVWLVRGWHDPHDPRWEGDTKGVERADGVANSGDLRSWFSAYQQSGPSY